MLDVCFQYCEQRAVAESACTVLLKTLKPVAKRLWTNAQQLNGGGGLTYKTDRHGASLVCVRIFVSVCVCVTVLLENTSRPTEERKKSSTALHHMPNMSLPANLWGILASASKAEFLTEGDE